MLPQQKSERHRGQAFMVLVGGHEEEDYIMQQQPETNDDIFFSVRTLQINLNGQ